jgi:hypothetical protein
MPSYRETLNDMQVQALVAYLKVLRLRASGKAR